MPRACDNKVNKARKPTAGWRTWAWSTTRAASTMISAPHPHQVRYLAGFYGLDELGLQLRRQAAQVGWDEAEQQIALSDGGNGLEEFFRKNFPLAECILDFWHAAEHLDRTGPGAVSRRRITCANSACTPGAIN